MSEEKLSFPSTSVLIPLGALLKSEDSKDLKETVAAERREIRENKGKRKMMLFNEFLHTRIAMQLPLFLRCVEFMGNLQLLADKIFTYA